MGNEKKASEAEILSHLLLFAYQETLRSLCVFPHTYLTHAILDSLIRICKRMNLGLVKGENLEDALNRYANTLKDSGLVKDAWFEKIGGEKYVFNVQGCLYARYVHSILKPEKLTCRFALIAMAIYEKFLGKRVKLADSDFTVDGSKTVIEPI